MFDITNLDSFNSCTDRKKQIELSFPTCREGAPPFVFVLVGTKVDLTLPDGQPAARAVASEDAEALAAGWGVQYVEVSARTGAGVDAACYLLVEEVLRRKHSHGDFAGWLSEDADNNSNNARGLWGGICQKCHWCCWNCWKW